MSDQRVTAHAIGEAIEQQQVVHAPASGGCTDPLDVQAMSRLMLRLDADAHRMGWDNPHLRRMFVIYKADDEVTDRDMRTAINGPGNITRVGPYAAAKLTRPHHFKGKRTPQALADYSYVMASAAISPLVDERHAEAWMNGQYMMALLRNTGVVGYGIQDEMWMADHEPGQPIPDRSLADIPGSKEARMLVALDLAGTWHSLLRVRGHKPHTYSGLQPWLVMSPISAALGVMSDVTLGRVTDDPEVFRKRHGLLDKWPTATDAT